MTVPHSGMNFDHTESEVFGLAKNAYIVVIIFFLAKSALTKKASSLRLWTTIKSLSIIEWLSLSFTFLDMFAIHEWITPYFYMLWDQTEIPDDVDFAEGSYKFVQKGFERNALELAGVVSCKLLMFYLCWEWNRGNKVLHYLSENVFKGKLHYGYCWVQLFMSPIVTKMIPNCVTYYDCYYLERAGHFSYEIFDIYTIMTHPMMQKSKGFAALVYLQFTSGCFESLSHEFSTVFQLSLYSKLSFPIETLYPGMMRAVLNPIIMFGFIGFDGLVDIWEHSDHQINHYLCMRWYLGLGAFKIGLDDTMYTGYHSEYFGAPTLNVQRQVETALHMLNKSCSLFTGSHKLSTCNGLPLN